MAPSERASTPMIWQGLCPPLGTVDASPVGSTDGTRGSWLKKDERVGGRQEADEEEMAILHQPFFFVFFNCGVLSGPRLFTIFDHHRSATRS